MSLSTLLTTAIVLWATTCYLIHGNAILFYLMVMIPIAGGFSWSMTVCERIK